jgi:hypothetical protein
MCVYGAKVYLYGSSCNGIMLIAQTIRVSQKNVNTPVVVFLIQVLSNKILMSYGRTFQVLSNKILMSYGRTYFTPNFRNIYIFFLI